MEKFLARLKQIIICFFLLFIGRESIAQNVCPPNIDFGFGDFTNWQCYAGSVSYTGGQNVVNVTPSLPLTNRHTMILPTTYSDPFGSFPVTPDNNPVVRLGFNGTTGSDAERISYTFTIPSSATTYSLTYKYAVVYQNPSHTPIETQPKFEAKVFDVTTGQYIGCASYTFYYGTSSGNGFLTSPTLSNGQTVLYKPWTPVTFILSDYIGHTMRLEFTNADCTQGGHWAYCYVDVANACNAPILGAEFCPGATTTTITAPYGYQGYHWWTGNFSSNVSNTQDLVLAPPPSGPTQYAVDLVPFAGLGCRDTVYATVKPFPVVPVNAGVDRLLCGTSGNQGPSTLGSPSLPGYSYNWSPATGLNDATIAQPIATPSATTDYVLTMTDLTTGCSKKDTVTVSVAPPITATFNINTPNQCLVGNNYQFTSSASNPSGTTYSWNFGDGSALNSLANPNYVYTVPGNYTVKLTTTNAAGCIDTTSQNVIISSQAIANAGADKALCGGSTSSVTIGTPGLTGYTYSWSPATGLSSTSVAQPNASPTATTTYVITATAPGNCTKTDTVVVTVAPSISGAFTVNNATQCLTGNSFQFSGSATNPAGLSYDWDFGDGTAHGTTQNATHNYTGANTYTATLIVSAGSCTATSSQTITVNAMPVVDAGADKLICGGSTTGVQIGTAAVSGNSYSWSPSAGLSSATSAQPTASPSATTNYVLTVTGPGGCTKTDTTVVTVTPTITGVFTVNNATQCLTGNNFQFTVSNPAGLTYDWDFGDGSAHGTAQNPTHTYAAANTYTVTVNVSGSGGCNATSTQTMTVNTTPVADAGADKLLCGGTTTGAQIGTPAVAGYTYSWSPATGLSSATVAQPTALPGTTTTYTLTVSKAGCSTTDNVLVTVTPTITGAFTVNAASQCLASNSFQFNINNPPGLTYDWDFGDGSAHGTTQNPTHTYTAANTYTVTVNVSGSAGCNATSSQTMTVNTTPVADAGADKLLCGGTTTGTQIGTPAVTGYTYSWSPAAGLSSASVAQPTALPGATTTYTLTVSNAGCSTTDNVLVTVTPTITGAFNVNAASQCLATNNFQFSMTNPPGLTYDWNFGDGSTHGTTQNPTHTYAAANTYTVTVNVSGAAGCNATSTQTMTVNAMPVADAGPDKMLCGGAGSNTQLGSPAVAGYTYSWSPATGLNNATAAQPIASPTATTNYTLTVTGPGGCTMTDAVTVTVTTALASGFTVNNNVQCITNNAFQFNVTNPIGGLTYAWNFGDNVTSSQQNPSHAYAVAGTYTVKLNMTSSVGCKDSASHTVTVADLPTGTITASGTNICEGTPVVLTAAGTPSNSYGWYQGTTLVGTTSTPTFNATQPGTYSVVYNNGCINKGVGTVTLTLTKKPTVDYTFTVKCLGNPTVFTDGSNVTGSTPVDYLWNFGGGVAPSTQPSPTITYPVAGTYNVQFTVTPQACPSLATTATKPVTVKGPTPNTRYPDKAALENVSLQLQARNIGSTYAWSPGTSLNNSHIMAPVFNGIAEVDYTITITDNLGCTTVDSQLVKVFKEVNIFMPKAFTPNGDGQNDRIYPYTIGIKSIRLFRIINRWGVIVYESKNDGKGWDGTYKGAPQPMDGYVWELQAVDYFGKNHTKQGSFTLIR